MLKTILVAFDGSDPSTRAFALSLEFATRFNADVLLARVTPSHEFDAMQEERMDEICEEMRNLCREAMRNGVRCKYRSDVGHSADRILRAVARVFRGNWIPRGGWPDENSRRASD